MRRPGDFAENTATERIGKSFTPPGSHTSFALAQNVGKLIRDLAGPTQPSVATQPISASASTGS
jgi:hypothetical protein